MQFKRAFGDYSLRGGIQRQLAQFKGEFGHYSQREHSEIASSV